jgi:hypothetical protein
MYGARVDANLGLRTTRRQAGRLYGTRATATLRIGLAGAPVRPWWGGAPRGVGTSIGNCVCGSLAEADDLTQDTYRPPPHARRSRAFSWV